MVVADLDMALITKRKRMMDSVGHYARPELLSLRMNAEPAMTTSPMLAAADHFPPLVSHPVTPWPVEAGSSNGSPASISDPGVGVAAAIA